jgi:hypothetical protein
MKSSYVYQIVNVVGGVVLLAVLLHYFSREQFLEWSLFTTLGGFTIQLESALSTVCSRLLVRVHHTSGPRGFASAVRQCRRWYVAFAVSVLLGLGAGGFAYFSRATHVGFTGSWVLEWLVFVPGYFFTYLFAYNCAVLIACEHVTSYALINMTTRVLNVSLSCLLVTGGSGVIGLSFSFLLAGALGGLAMWWAGSRAVRGIEGKHAAVTGNPPTPELLDLRHVVLSFAFIVGSYGLYRAGLLIDASSRFEADVQASYGLALQIFTLLMTLSAVPINMLVAPLQRAVLGKDSAPILREMARLAVYANITYITGVGALIGIGPIVFRLLASRAPLPQNGPLLLLALGFLLELNILLLVNVAMASRSYRFVAWYACSAVVGLAAGTLLRSHGAGVYVAFGLVPALAQLAIALPLIFREVARLCRITASGYLAHCAAFLGEVVRHPIKAGPASG